MDKEKIKNLAEYLISKYPKPSDLSKARLVKMLYLADWRSAIMHKRQITNVDWIFNHYGPYVPEIIDCLLEDGRFTLKKASNFFGGAKNVMTLTKGYSSDNTISDGEKEIIDFVIEKTSSLNWDTFIELVYGTFPIRVSNRFDQLDLSQLAKDYE